MSETVLPVAPQLELSFESLPSTPIDWKAQVPSVSQLTRKIRGQLENIFFDVWVKGEVSNFRKPHSGHAYFILKDASAQLRAVLFRPVLSKMKFQLQDGIEILLHGKVTVYETRGEYQIIADHAEPVGVGALQLAFEQLKKTLQTEGLFDEKHKVPIPTLPQRIGIITSPTGAAVRDILKILDRRFPNLHCLVIPTAVQGEKAAPEIVAAIDRAERWNEERRHEKIDVLIVGRGGGSLEDLWPFNEEIVARRIFSASIPIISAVGHEIDFTMCDFVADLRAPTPSAAAEIAVPRKDEILYRINTFTERLSVGLKRQCEQYKLHITHLSRRLVDPRVKIREFREKSLQYLQKMQTLLRHSLLISKTNLQSLALRLNTLSPLAVLGRGYSITRKDGDILHSVDGIAPLQILQTSLMDGTIVSEVKSVAPGKIL